MKHFPIGLLVVLLLVSAEFSMQAPSPSATSASAGPVVQKLVQTVQQVHDMANANGLPFVQTTAQKVMNQLGQFTDSDLYFGNPCSFFTSIFRNFYCTISNLDSTGRNPAIQGLLQFLNVNEMFFNFAQTFFCPFAAFGGGGDGNTGGANGNGPQSASGCPAGGVPTGAGTTGAAGAPLDNPVGF